MPNKDFILMPNKFFLMPTKSFLMRNKCLFDAYPLNGGEGTRGQGRGGEGRGPKQLTLPCGW